MCFNRRMNLPQKFLDEYFAKETGAAGDENGSICVHFTHSVFFNVVHSVIIIRCHCELWVKWSTVIRLKNEIKNLFKKLIETDIKLSVSIFFFFFSTSQQIRNGQLYGSFHSCRLLCSIFCTWLNMRNSEHMCAWMVCIVYLFGL